MKSLRSERKSPKVVDISAPYNFKLGPAINFPGYSEDDISLMREKAIASIAIVDEEHYGLAARIQRPHSRTSCNSCGHGSSKVLLHSKRISRSYAH